jgi:hypothetical protein
MNELFENINKLKEENKNMELETKNELEMLKILHEEQK